MVESPAGAKSAESPAMSQSSQAPLSEHEGNVLRDLARSVESMDSRFCCGGSVEIEVDSPVLLYLLSEPRAELGDHTIDARALHLNGSEATVVQLHEFCVPSPHGVGSQTVYDESYRVARELRSPRFGLNFDPLRSTNGILDTVAATCVADVYAKIYKLNSYTEGGFFKAHKDTPKSEEHIGTLLISLPSVYQGGQLRLSHGDKSVTFDWARNACTSPMPLQWAFFFSDVVHEILPVTSGYRLTLAYDVFRKEKDLTAHHPLALRARDTPLFADFHRLWTDARFLPHGGTLAFGLQHAYPVKEKGWPKSFGAFLKGSDGILHSVLLAHNATVQIKAVYQVALEDYEDRLDSGQRNIPQCTDGGDFCALSHKHWSVLVTSDDFSGVYQGDYVEGDDILDEIPGARVQPEVIWCRRPGPPVPTAASGKKQRAAEAYSLASSYIVHGNEASIEFCYVAAALFVTVPPASERQSV